MKRIYPFIAFIAIAISSVLSCQKGPEEILVSSISLSKSALELTVGEEFTLAATITPDNATNKEVTWKSDNEEVATVSAEGVVRAIKAGTANISVTTVDQGKTASCAVTVEEILGAVTGEATHISCRNARLSGNFTMPQTASTNLSFGVLYSTSSDVLPDDATRQEVEEADSGNSFTVDTGVLEPETTYYFRSYAVLGDEEAYGEIKSFKTLALSSMIQTLDADNIDLREATLNAMLDLTDCNYSSIEFGFELTPEDGQPKTLKANNLADKAFSYRDENLVMNTGYSYVAYVKLDGTLYKAESKTFTTASIQASVTAEVSDIKCIAATISGRLDVQSEGSFSKSAVLYYSSSESTLEGLESNGASRTVYIKEDGSYSAVLSSLSSSTSYNFAVVAKVDGVEFVSAIGNFSTLSFPIPSSVDLGLSVKWASANLGASKPTEYGGYYQWAGIEDVSKMSTKLDWSNCPYHTSSAYNSGWTKYNTKSSYGTVDNRTVLEAMDDAVSVYVGGNWRMPTIDEWNELLNTDNCSWTWTTIDDVKGYKVQSKKSGYTDNWIFLPAAGFRSEEFLTNGDREGYYLSSSLNAATTVGAFNIILTSENFSVSSYHRYCGQSIRPISE